MKRVTLRVYSPTVGGDDWGEATTTAYPDQPTGTLERVLLYPLGSVSTSTEEPGKAGYENRVITDLTALVPPDSNGHPQYVLQSNDRVRLPDGSDWAVEGRVHDWASPFTDWQPGYEVALKSVEG